METNELINQMIDKIIDGDNVAAQSDFESIISQKMEVSLDAKKQEVAQSLYTGEPKVEDETEENSTDVDNSEIA